MKRKKVLFLITKSNWGGAQRYVFDLATTLPAEQFDVVVALGGDGPLVEKLAAAGIRVQPIPGLARDISLTKELLAGREISRLMSEERPDILHVNSSKAGFVGAVLGRCYRVPRVIFTAHAWAFNEDRLEITRWIFGGFHWLTILFAHHTITASDALQREMRWPGTAKKMTTIYHGRDIPQFSTTPDARAELTQYVPALATYPNDICTGTIAELHNVKRHDVMIKAVAVLRQRGVIVRHVIIGDGELRAELEVLVRAEKLEEQVFFAGAVLEAARLLPAFAIFTLTSRSEALGYAVIEAAQAGVPIVASRVGGIPEIITSEKEGLLVPVGDVKAVADAIERLSTEPSLSTTLAQAAKQKSQKFSIATMVEQTIAIYRQA